MAWIFSLHCARRIIHLWFSFAVKRKKNETSGNARLSAEFDLAVVGGGINDCGIAREAGWCGLPVYLRGRGERASAASSTSTKLVRGGLRHLVQYELRLLREALRGREVPWRLARHIVKPLRFVLPLHSGLRSSWMLRLGLFRYDHLGGRMLLPATKTLNLARGASGAPLKPEFSRAFEYSGCWVDDSRTRPGLRMTAAETAELGNWRAVRRLAQAGCDQPAKLAS